MVMETKPRAWKSLSTLSLLLLLTLLTLQAPPSASFSLLDIAHYLDYIPYRQEGLVAFEDFRTAPYPPLPLRNRKMEIGPGLQHLSVEDITDINVWPSNWPYGPEDFRPMDYGRDEVANTLPQYQYSQSLIEADQVTIIPGFLRIPIRRHFILPKDKIALAEHLSSVAEIPEGASVLELFATYDSILPPVKLGPTVGVGWSPLEMKANAALDDWIEQDISVDPYLPLADNYFDFVVMPANFQLLQRPREMFEEINRVLKPGGTAVIGVKLALWSFLGWKQGRYYAETNYLEDVLALRSFLHFAGGFNKARAYDLTLPEVTLPGKIKDVLFPQKRLDFYACVQATKRKDSPHGKERKVADKPPSIEGLKFAPRMQRNPVTGEEKFGPFY